MFDYTYALTQTAPSLKAKFLYFQALST